VSLPDSIYQYPFLPFAETTLAVNSSGMAVRFLDLCEMLFQKREASAVQQSNLKNARYLMEQARGLFYETVEISWTAILNTHSIRPHY
jgi:hypothetical protein